MKRLIFVLILTLASLTLGQFGTGVSITLEFGYDLALVGKLVVADSARIGKTLKVEGDATFVANVGAATYGSDGSISDAELLTLDNGATTTILVGGGAGSAPVWTTATGTGSPVRATAPTFTGQVSINASGSTIGLSVDGNKTSANLGQFINDNDGAVGDSSVTITKTGGVTAGGNIAAATYGSDGSISNAELLTLDDGATTEILVGGGAGSAPVWTTANGTGAPVRATAPTFTGLVSITTSGSTKGLSVDGNKTSGNLAEFINDNDGVAGDSAVVVTKLGGITASGAVSAGTLTIGSSNMLITRIDTVFTATFVPRWLKFTTGSKVVFTPFYAAADTVGKW